MLASASPRRRAILAAAGLAFEVRPAGVPEDLPEGIAAVDAARELALRKARAHREQGVRDDVLWIGSDTVVAVSEASGRELLLGKPADAAEARAFLGRLSGTTHCVVTGVAVVRGRDGAEVVGHERTLVTMRPLEPAEIDAYVASGEWRDKAGGYAIQENADAFVTELAEGGFDNVVGLPLELTLALLGRLGGPVP